MISLEACRKMWEGGLTRLSGKVDRVEDFVGLEAEDGGAGDQIELADYYVALFGT